MNGKYAAKKKKFFCSLQIKTQPGFKFNLHPNENEFLHFRTFFPRRQTRHIIYIVSGKSFDIVGFLVGEFYVQIFILVSNLFNTIVLWAEKWYIEVVSTFAYDSIIPKYRSLLYFSLFFGSLECFSSKWFFKHEFR